MSIENNIPAFPLDYYVEPKASPLHSGMTLLDYFAAKYMSAIVSNCGESNDLERLCSESYDAAAAMLNARKKYIK